MREAVTVEVDTRVELRVARVAVEASGTESSDVRLRWIELDLDQTLRGPGTLEP